MIASDVEVLGVEPAGYAWLCDRVAARQGLEGQWLWARHDGEQLLAMVPVPGPEVPVAEGLDLRVPEQAAAMLREVLGYERVVLVDERRTAELARALDEAADPSLSQWQFFQACQERFWTSPAISTDPERPSNRWAELSAAMRELGDGQVALVVMDADALFLALRAVVRDGLVVRITGALGDAPAPPGLAAVLERVDQLGAPDIVLACERADLEAALGKRDVVTALFEMGQGAALHTRGLERLGALLRSSVPAP